MQAVLRLNRIMLVTFLPAGQQESHEGGTGPAVEPSRAALRRSRDIESQRCLAVNGKKARRGNAARGRPRCSPCREIGAQLLLVSSQRHLPDAVPGLIGGRGFVGELCLGERPLGECQAMTRRGQRGM